MKTVLVSCLVLFLSLSLVVHSEKNSLDLNLLRGLFQGGEKDCTFKCFGGESWRGVGHWRWYVVSIRGTSSESG